MNHPRTWLLVGLAAPALLALSRPADEIAFHPKEGLSLTKTFAIKIDSSLDDMEMVVDGNDMDSPPLEVDTTQSISITVADHYAKVAGNRAAVLERTYAGLSGDMDFRMNHPMMGEKEFEATSESDLEGTTVVFTWNEDDEAYTRAFGKDSEDEDEDLLENLDADMDLTLFLPGHAVAEGDTWSFPPSAIKNVLAAGGDVKLVPQDLPAEMDSSSGVDFAQQLGDVDGDCTAVYGGTKLVDGRTVAVIDLTIQVSSNKDITEMMAEAAASSKQAQQMGVEQDVQSADITFEFELEGQLLWDVEGGHFHSLELSGSTESVLDLAAAVNAMGQSMDVEQSMYSSGTVEVSVSLTSE